MKKENTPESKQKFSVSKSLKGILITIFLGAIGSGIWDRFLSGASDGILSILSNLYVGISKSYLDYFYNNVGDGIKEIFSYYPYILFMGASIALMFGTLIYFIQWRTTESEEGEVEKEDKIDVFFNRILDKKVSRKIFKIISITYCLVALFYFVGLVMKHLYTYNTIIYIEKSIDILAPHIENKEALILKAEYRKINNYSTFENFDLRLKNLSKKQKIEIPEFRYYIK